ncbi:hypothetical protein ACE103_09625 [Bradyrhizobium sp. ma5]|uniref:hypothetical protein n=1 Tax=Bradyrhizobium sp. ma5 TaxID=3344828 RepID=UPI0035D49476
MSGQNKRVVSSEQLGLPRRLYLAGILLSLRSRSHSPTAETVASTACAFCEPGRKRQLPRDLPVWTAWLVDFASFSVVQADALIASKYRRLMTLADAIYGFAFCSNKSLAPHIPCGGLIDRAVA